jgi:hypothetical protein
MMDQKLTLRIKAFEMADFEKRRNGMDVVCRAERKCLLTFEPAPQLNTNSRQRAGWPSRWILLACITSALLQTENPCDTKRESQHMP